MKLSIVVPVRNGEDYLSQCIESILRQTFTDFELILINNASTDGSELIIDRYRQMDKRIVVLYADNLKVNAVRKIGVTHAVGEYIGFVDCDDWVECDMYDTLLDFCDKNKLDMASSGMIKEFVHEKRKEKFPDNIPAGVYNKIELRDKVYPTMLCRQPLFSHGVQPNIWNKLFRREIITDIFADLDTDIIYGEDATVVYAALLKSSRVGFVNENYYHYRIHDKSNTYTVQKEFLTSSLKLYRQLETIFKNDEQFDVLFEQLKYFMLATSFFNLNLVFGINVHEMMRWYMPFSYIISGKKVALFGAGNVGHDFYNAINLCCDVELVHWVDNNRSIVEDGKKESPFVLTQDRVDFVIIAVKEKLASAEIKQKLKEYGYNDKQILWQDYKKQLLI